MFSFSPSTVVSDVKVENNIGDALVKRIIRAHRDHTPWKCCILIPLLPGFTFPVDHSDASAVRHFLVPWAIVNLTVTHVDSDNFGVSEPDYSSWPQLHIWPAAQRRDRCM
jgi:hypothetical protein